MADEVGMCNRALALVKVNKRITALTQTNSKEAEVCALQYTEARDYLLERHDWNFAARRVRLAQDSTTPATEWSYAYSLPGDFIKLTKVADNTNMSGKVRYRLEGGLILTDAPQLYLKYVRRENDPNLMPPTFRVALEHLLASRLSVALTNNRTQSAELRDEFEKEHLLIAMSADALQDDEDDFPESEWVSARSGDEYEVEGQPAT